MGHALRMTPEQVAERAKRLGARIEQEMRRGLGVVAKPATETRRRAVRKPKTIPKIDYPAMLAKQIKMAGLPAPVLEYRFDRVRRWRFDMAWRQQLVALEVDGGIWSQGRHTRGAGFLKDLEKLNVAAQEGWRVIRVTPDMVKTGRALELVDWMCKYWIR